MVKNLKLNKSRKLFESAKKIIPLASQTFSRSYLFFDKNYFPLFLKRGNGQFVYDLDNNKYLDFINALGSVSIGYGNTKIINSVNKATKFGNSFSLSHPLEVTLAKRIKKLIPSAEMIRYGKNGTDVNSAAIRLARYYTKRNNIAVCGYHGWQDWYIASTGMSGGIPKILKNYIYSFEYNNLKSLKVILSKKKCAAVIMEPLSYTTPSKNYLLNVKKLCKKFGTLLIFDEICTGFRVSLGGAQKLYNITPDLSTFGKGMANGYPLSVLVGKKEIMKYMSKIFYSGTFAGEISSLAACNSTIDFMIKNKCIQKNKKKGLFLKKELERIIYENNLQSVIKIDGDYSWLFLKVLQDSSKAELIKSFIKQELIKEKILFLGSFNITHSHDYNDLRKLISCFKKIFKNLRINKNKLKKIVKTRISKNLFEVRKAK